MKRTKLTPDPEPEIVSERDDDERPMSRQSKPKQRKGNKGSVTTLQEALGYIDNLKIADGSKHIYKKAISDLVGEYIDGSLVSDILQNPKEVIDTVSKMTHNNDTSKLLSMESQKIIYTAIRVLTSKGAVEGVDPDDIKAFNAQMKLIARTTERKRAELDRRGNLKNNPDLTWETVLEKREEYEKSKYLTVQNLTNLLLVSFYTLIKPRRLELRLLKVYHKHPDNEERENYLVVRPRADVPMFLQTYKTAERNQRVFLGTYKADLPSGLVSLFRLYIKKRKIDDGEYLFPNGEGAELPDTAFSRLVKKASKAVLGCGLTVNDYRHLYIDFVSRHIEQYDDLKLQEIARGIGDASVLTALRYRLAEQKNTGKTTSQIHKEILEEREREIQRTREMEDEGSVGDLEDQGSPTRPHKAVEGSDDEIESVGGGEHRENESDSKAEVIMLKSRQSKKSVDKHVDKVIEVLRPLLTKLLSL